MVEEQVPQITHRLTVTVEYLDGQTERIEAEGPLNVQATFVLVPIARQGHIGFSLAAVKRWEASVSGIAVPLRPVRGLQ